MSIPFTIARSIKRRISALGYITTDEKLEPETIDGISDCLTRGVSDLSVQALNRFTVRLNRKVFNRAVRRDFFYGAIRIRKLNNAARCLLLNNEASAWALTTCYYASFFCAVELLRCSGTFITYLTEEQIQSILERSQVPPVGARLETGTYEGIAKYDSATEEVSIAFVKRNIRHHAFTWTQIKEIIKESGRSVTGVDATIQRRLEQFMGQESGPAWPSPSDVRNFWNYEQSSHFGAPGEKICGTFKKLLITRGSALKWGAGQTAYPGHDIKAAAMAFIMNVLGSWNFKKYQ